MGFLKELVDRLKDTPEMRKARLEKKKDYLEELEVESKIAKKQREIRETKSDKERSIF